jgi:hypothetical protein
LSGPSFSNKWNLSVGPTNMQLTSCCPIAKPDAVAGMARSDV